MSSLREVDDLTLPFTCPECGDSASRERYAQVDYLCPECNLSVAHVDLAPTGMVREVFGWLLSPGQVLFDRYRVVNLLGRGGFAATYGVEDMRLANRRCALKEIPQPMFDRGEMEILSRLHHPGIPNIRDTFEQGEMVYMVLEFGGSRSLSAERVERGGRIHREVLLPWIGQLCEVLEYLHSQNPPIVHRDLKPGNVLVNENGRISLIDFGIAKESDAGTQTRTIARSASHGFSPPEQVMGTGTDQRSDVYALGATLYQLLTGQKPVPAHERVAGTEMMTPRSLLPDAPPELESLIVRAMELNINRRVQSIREFATKLEAIHSRRPDTVSPPNIDDAPTFGGDGRMPESLVRGQRTVVGSGSARVQPGGQTPATSGGFPVWLGALIAVGVVGAAGAAWWIQRDPSAETATRGFDATAAVPAPAVLKSTLAELPAAPPASTGRGSEGAIAAPTRAETASRSSALDVPEASKPEKLESKPAPAAKPLEPRPPRVAPRRTRQPVEARPVRAPPAPSPPLGAQAPPQDAGAADPEPKPEPDWGKGFKQGTTRRLD